MGMVQEFKEFALKGSMVDMAIGIVMGGAIGQVVGSMVENLINPVVGLFTGGTDFSQLRFALNDAGKETLYLRYGDFFNAVFQFLILAFVVFLIVKSVNNAKRQMGLMKPEAPKGPSEVDLLTEIRDSLKKA